MTITRRLGRLAAAALLAAGVTGLGAQPAPAQESAATPDTVTETYGAWTLRCRAKDTPCVVFQALYRAKDKARLVQVAVFDPPGEEKGLTLRALTPLGASIGAGVTLSLDEETPMKLPFDSCWKHGCVADMALDAATETALRAGKELSLVLVNAENGQKVRFKLSLEGVGRALDRLKSM